MPKFCFLSHIIEQKIPEYGKGNIALDDLLIKSIERGDSCNMHKTNLSSHIGTHIDCPRHFFDKGKSISCYPADYCILNEPFVIYKNLRKNEIVNKEVFFSVPLNADMVIFKSNFQRFRKKPEYSFNNPGISEEAANWLRKNRPKVKILGVDFISISSFKNRELGRRSHEAFLNPNSKNKPILILEDMNLSALNNKAKLSMVWVFPLRVGFWDSAPCTVIGKI